MSSPISWTPQSSASDNNWIGVTYGNGLFVAVANTGTSNRIMTSTNGINWTSGTSSVYSGYNFFDVTYGTPNGSGLFVAVWSSVVTSPDGTTWTIQTTPANNNNWRGVTYGTPNGSGLFVAVAFTGTQRAMSSPDGSTWTATTSTIDSNNWQSVTYGTPNNSGLFVAVASSGTQRVMTSPDGLTWTSRNSAYDDNSWSGVTYGTPNGSGLFVAVGNFSVMTSTNGIDWTLRSNPTTSRLTSVTYGNGLFVAVAAFVGTGNRSISSPDGINWTLNTTPADNNWRSVTYGDNLFVAVASSGTGNRVMTGTISIQPTPTPTPTPIANICFASGTPINCDQGIIPIEYINLKKHTIHNKKIIAITKTTSLDNYLICFEKNALGNNIPCRRTIISKDHLIYNQGHMIKAEDFINKYQNIYKVKYNGEILYNILLEKYDTIIANNLICETLHPCNNIAKLYIYLSKCNLEKQYKVIKNHNSIIKSHNLHL
jgi:hypothetical protein